MSDDKLVNGGVITQAMCDNAKAIWLEYLDKPRTEIMDLFAEVYEVWKRLDPAIQSERASMEGEIERLHLAINDAIHWLSRDWPEEADRILRAALTSSKTGDE